MARYTFQQFFPRIENVIFITGSKSLLLYLSSRLAPAESIAIWACGLKTRRAPAKKGTCPTTFEMRHFNMPSGRPELRIPASVNSVKDTIAPLVS